MKLEIKRIAKKEGYTIGRMYVDGAYFCDTLEDTDRGLRQDMSLREIIGKKVAGKTAIPTGRYELELGTISPKFGGRSWAKCCGGKVPRLEGVKGYSGVLIHVGNSEKDTEGCILVGLNSVKGRLVNSASTFARLMELLNNTPIAGRPEILIRG